MSESDWEDIAVGSPIPSASIAGGDEWEDVAIGAPLRAGASDAARIATGGGLNLLNALTFGYGDEAVSGVNALIDSATGDQSLGQAYDQRLQEARSLRNEFRDEAGGLQYIHDVGGAFAMPLATSLKATDGLIKSGAKLAAEGGGYGALYGFGEAEGGVGNRIKGAREGLAAGSILAPTLGLPLIAGAKALSGAGKLGALAASPEEIAARKLIEAGGDDIGKLAEVSDNPLYQYQTLAEATQNPKLAQLEQEVTKTSARGNELKYQNELARRDVQEQMFRDLAPADPRSAESGGSAVRSLIDEEALRRSALAEEGLNNIDKNNLVPISNLRQEINAAAGQIYEAGGMPGELKGILKEINKTVDNPMPLDPNGADALIKPSEQPFSYMHALRRRAQSAWKQAKDIGDKDAANLANQVVRAVDKEIDRAGAAGMMPQADVDSFVRGKAAWAKYADEFESGNIGAVRSKVKEGQYLMGDTAVVDSIFNGTAERTKKLLTALPKTEDALQNARAVVRDKILKVTVNNDGKFSPAQFRKYVRLNEEGLTAKVNGRALFEPTHMRDIKRIADDLAFLDPQSAKSVRSLAYAASKGQPTTAQALFMGGYAKKALSVIPGANKLVEFAEMLAVSKQEKVNEVLGRALFDKGYAKHLSSRATPQKLVESLQYLSRAMQDTASTTRRLGAATVPATSSQSASIQKPSAPQQYKQEEKQSDNSYSNYRQDPQPTQAQKQNISYSKDIKSLPPLVQAIIQVESAGKHRAVSPKGAKGLMQLMPANIKKFGIKDPFDPDENIKGGMRLLSEEVNRFKDLKLAVAAYNAGSPKVNYAIKKAGSRDFEAIKKYLPLETRNYVTKVLGVLGRAPQANRNGAPQLEV